MGAQYGTLTALHTVQDADRRGMGLQLLGIDISKAFDSISGRFIQEWMILNGFPSIFFDVVHTLTKKGVA